MPHLLFFRLRSVSALYPSTSTQLFFLCFQYSQSFLHPPNTNSFTSLLFSSELLGLQWIPFNLTRKLIK
ncbi:hypothetical protein VNO78_06091 [Psophocarpus tetragonolobus]|uniref:Uncharacterized protein n=1 Tax=Psophocarpus tetragonolobus TaxID=3891 RepID=A0AAN9STS3_PSOTE